MVNDLSQILMAAGNELSSVALNHYTLSIDELTSDVSVFAVRTDEQLNQPWHYEIIFQAEILILLLVKTN